MGDDSLPGATGATPDGDPAAFDPRALAARRLGWFGGSFDPPHRGHLHVARTAAAVHDLDHLVWVPAARSPHKDARPTDGDERARLVEALLRDDADAGGDLAARSSIWCGELARGGASYAIESLRILTVERPVGDTFLLLGGDQLRGLDRWREVDALLVLARPVVVPRPGAGRELLEDLRGRLAPASFQRVAAGLVAAAEVDLASTDLRARLGAGDDGADLAPRVRRRIAERGLYGGAGPDGGAPAP